MSEDTGAARDRRPISEEVLTGRIIAIVRGGDPGRLLQACETIADGGIRCIEVTTNTPGWQDAVAALASRRELHVGVGTVLNVGQVREAASAGAAFVVSPNVDPTVGDAADAAGLAWYPGAVTPTEIVTAWSSGATAVKVFPIATLGGIGYLRQVRAPLDRIPMIPTGGVTLDQVAGYLDAGATAVGIGSPLIGDALDGGSLDELRARAEAGAGAVAAHG